MTLFLSSVNVEVTNHQLCRYAILVSLYASFAMFCLVVSAYKTRLSPVSYCHPPVIYAYPVSCTHHPPLCASLQLAILIPRVALPTLWLAILNRRLATPLSRWYPHPMGSYPHPLVSHPQPPASYASLQLAILTPWLAILTFG